jgi:hypothetical protein
VVPPRHPRAPAPGARRRRIALAAAGAAACAAAAAAVAVLAGGTDEGAIAGRFTAAWERSDWAAMHAELTPADRRRVPVATLRRAYERAAVTATARDVQAGRPREREDGSVQVPVTVQTTLFGTVRSSVVLPVRSGEEEGIAWTRALVFPGLRRGERLSARTRLPERADLLSRDGSVLARGPARTPDPALADVALDTVGQLGVPGPDRLRELKARGVPADARVGLSGLERALDDRLRGQPGGQLRAGGRVLAATAPRKARPVRTTIAPAVVRAAVAALAGRLGGVTAIDPRTGEVLGFAGIAFSGLQPPGSTMKIVTLAAALEAGITSRRKRYPVQTAATLEGVEIQNANGESCGGTLAQAFAESCNSVFAPMGAELGAKRFVAAAQAFGFNAPAPIPGAAPSTLPAAGEIGDDLAVGSSAIGQGRLQATSLQMADVAATIARGGLRPLPTLDLDRARAGAGDAAPRDGARAVPEGVARTVSDLMVEVVRDGTGTAAKIDGVRVAGKTGTAELETTRRCAPTEVDPQACQAGAEDITTDTSAWFSAFAPALPRTARVAVGVLVVRAGAGGATAAPVARQVLQAALERG